MKPWYLAIGILFWCIILIEFSILGMVYSCMPLAIALFSIGFVLVLLFIITLVIEMVKCIKEKK